MRHNLFKTKAYSIVLLLIVLVAMAFCFCASDAGVIYASVGSNHHSVTSVMQEDDNTLKALGEVSDKGLKMTLSSVPVAKVGETTYTNINEALAAWTSGTTLTLLQDIETTEAKKLDYRAGDNYFLNLGEYTWTAVGCDAIELYAFGDAPADGGSGLYVYAKDGGGISVDDDYRCFYLTENEADAKAVEKGIRPRLEIRGGEYNGGYFINTLDNNDTYNTARIFLYDADDGSKLICNAKIDTCRSHLEFRGGVYNDEIINLVESKEQYFVLSKESRFKILPSGSNSMSVIGLYVSIDGSGNDLYIYFDGEYYSIVSEISYGTEAQAPFNNDQLNCLPWSHEAGRWRENSTYKKYGENSSSQIRYTNNIQYAEADTAILTQSEVILNPNVVSYQDKTLTSNELANMKIHADNPGCAYKGTVTLTKVGNKLVISGQKADVVVGGILKSDYKVKETYDSQKNTYTYTAEKKASGEPDNIIVTTTSKMLDSSGNIKSDVSGIALLSGGGQYDAGAEITLTAGALDNFKFKGWYESGADESLTFISRDMECKVSPKKDTDYIAMYQSNATSVTITIGKEGNAKDQGSVLFDYTLVDCFPCEKTVNVGDTIELSAEVLGEAASEMSFVEVTDKASSEMANEIVTEAAGKSTGEAASEMVSGVQSENSSENPGESADENPGNPKAYFICWRNEKGAVLSLDPTYRTTVLQAQKIEAVFIYEGAAVVQFYDDNDNLLSAGMYTESEAENITTVVALSKKGHKFEGWRSDKAAKNILTNDGVKTLIKNTANEAAQRSAAGTGLAVGVISIYAKYSEAASYSVTLHVVNEASETVGDTVTIEKTLGEAVVLRASDDPDGLEFKGFSKTAGAGNIITQSYKLPFNPDEGGDYDFYAVFGEKGSAAVERHAVISVGKAFNSSTTVQKIGLSMSWAIPDDAKLLEAGFYYGFAPDKNDLVIDETTKTFKTNMTGPEGSYTVNLNVSKYPSYDICLAAYVKYEQNGKKYLVINGEEDSIGGYVVDADELPKTLDGVDNLTIVNYNERGWTLSVAD